MALADVIGTVVAGHNPISETISKLAIGDHAWIQDLGLDAYAAGVAALAAGLYMWVGSESWRWTAGLCLLLVLGADVVLIAEHNQYAGRPGQGAAIHIYLVYALYVLVAGSALLLAEGLKALGGRWRVGSYALAGFWLLLAPFFFVVPDSVNGAYERFLALFLLLGVAVPGWKLARTDLGG